MPAVAIIADEMIGSAEAMKKLSGAADFEYAVVPYPVVSNTADEIRDKAHKLVPRIVELLTGRSG